MHVSGYIEYVRVQHPCKYLVGYFDPHITDFHPSKISGLVRLDDAASTDEQSSLCHTPVVTSLALKQLNPWRRVEVADPGRTDHWYIEPTKSAIV